VQLENLPARALGEIFIGRPTEVVVLLVAGHTGAEGQTVAIQQRADAAQQVQIVGAVIAPAAAALQRLDSCEFGFPETQNMLGNIEFGSDFADGAKGLWRFLRRAVE